MKAIVEKVHQHVCGHSNYTDMRVLLERNNFWNDQVEKYLSQVLEAIKLLHGRSLLERYL